MDKKKIMMILSIVVIVVCAGFSVYMLTNKDNDDSDEDAAEYELLDICFSGSGHDLTSLLLKYMFYSGAVRRNAAIL